MSIYKINLDDNAIVEQINNILALLCGRMGGQTYFSTVKRQNEQ